MSAGTIVAKRYAKALFELASQQNAVSDVEQQLKVVTEALKRDEDIAAFLSTPNIGTDRKVAVLKEALAGKVSELVLNTVELVIERGRQNELKHISDAYSKISGDATGQATATVYTAKALDDSELAKVAQRFAKIAGKAIRAEQVVEPSLIGGIQVRIGDRLYDGSLSGKLARLEKSLKS